MNLLDEEPEKKGRYRRFGIGLGLALSIGTGVVLAADQVSPVRRLKENVLKMAIIDKPMPPPKKAEDTPPPPPPPPPPKNAPKPKADTKQQPAPVAQPIKQNDNQPEPVGLDADSFGSGTGGPAFAQGTTLMGTPGEAARQYAAAEEAPKPKPKLIEARPKAGNVQPAYTERARRLGIQGLMVIETEVDEHGKVVKAVVRGKLEPVLDAEAQKTVMNWRFDPATLDGQAVPSTKWLRIRFALE